MKHVAAKFTAVLLGVSILSGCASAQSETAESAEVSAPEINTELTVKACATADAALIEFVNAVKAGSDITTSWAEVGSKLEVISEQDRDLLPVDLGKAYGAMVIMAMLPPTNEGLGGRIGELTGYCDLAGSPMTETAAWLASS